MKHEELTLLINGARRTGVFPRGTRLLDAIRRLGFTGTKEGCGEGECGACSVVMDGRVVNSCLVYARQAEGRTITTVEALGEGHPGGLHPFQRAMVETGGVQCGFCTPGLIVTAHDLLRRSPRPSEPEIREALAGNLCRCTGYQKIVEAVQLAAERLA